MTKQRPGVVRKVQAQPRRPVDPDAFAATLYPEGLELRPLRTRRPDATVYVTWEQVYQWALIARTPPVARRKKGRRKAR